MEMSDAEDSSETEDEGQDGNATEDQGRVEGEPNLDDFMDWEYLKQGKYYLLCRLHCVRAENSVFQPATSRNTISRSVEHSHFLFVAS